jgi:hypothetical protein
VTKALAGNRRESLESARACERIQYVEARQDSRVHTYVVWLLAWCVVWLGKASTRTVPSKGTKQEDQLLHKIRPFFSRPRHHAHGRRRRRRAKRPCSSRSITATTSKRESTLRLLQPRRPPPTSFSSFLLSASTVLMMTTTASPPPPPPPPPMLLATALFQYFAFELV